MRTSRRKYGDRATSNFFPLLPLSHHSYSLNFCLLCPRRVLFRFSLLLCVNFHRIQRRNLRRGFKGGMDVSGEKKGPFDFTVVLFYSNGVHCMPLLL